MKALKFLAPSKYSLKKCPIMLFARTSYLCTYDLYGLIRNALTRTNQFSGPVKWHQAVMRMPFGAQKSRDLQGPTPSHLTKK